MSVKILDGGGVAFYLIKMAALPRPKQEKLIGKMLTNHLAQLAPGADPLAAANDFRRRFINTAAGYPELKQAMGAVYSRFVETYEVNK